MPSFLLSPLVKWSFAALGGAMVVHWVVKEARRINEELENGQAREGADYRCRESPDLAARSGDRRISPVLIAIVEKSLAALSDRWGADRR